MDYCGTAFIEAKLFADQAHSASAEAKDRLIALASHTSETESGVTVTRFWKRGAIEYTKIPEMKALDLEKFRSAPREVVRVTTT